MKIYTRTGDKGQTAVIGGRVSKDDSRVEAYGTVDELNSFVGQAASLMAEAIFADFREDLLLIQHELFDCGSDLAFLEKKDRVYKVTSGMVTRLEAWIDRYDEEAPKVKRFILPGGSVASSSLHVCRTVCRRAERCVVTLAADTQEINEEVLRYLNRLSDLFFAMARAANARAGLQDVEYVRSAEVFNHKS